MAAPLLAGLMVGQAVLGIGTQIFGMIGQSKAKKEAEEMRKRMEAQTQASNQAIIAQFQASTGLSGNIGGATGNQQGVPGGQFPQFMG